MIYQATVEDSDKNIETYVGLCGTTFKLRYSNHKKSFLNEKYRGETTLSQHIWVLKDQGKQFNVTWQIMAFAKPYNTATKTCNLCSKEKYFIIFQPEKASLNKRTELISICRHRAPSLLKNNCDFTFKYSDIPQGPNYIILTATQTRYPPVPDESYVTM